MICEQVALGQLATVFFLDQPELPARLVGVAVVRRAVDRAEERRVMSCGTCSQRTAPGLERDEGGLATSTLLRRRATS